MAYFCNVILCNLSVFLPPKKLSKPLTSPCLRLDFISAGARFFAVLYQLGTYNICHPYKFMYYYL